MPVSCSCDVHIRREQHGFSWPARLLFHSTYLPGTTMWALLADLWSCFSKVVFLWIGGTYFDQTVIQCEHLKHHIIDRTITIDRGSLSSIVCTIPVNRQSLKSMAWTILHNGQSPQPELSGPFQLTQPPKSFAYTMVYWNRYCPWCENHTLVYIPGSKHARVCRVAALQLLYKLHYACLNLSIPACGFPYSHQNFVVQNNFSVRYNKPT